MFWEIFTFELKCLFKRPMVYGFFLMFILLTFGPISTDRIVLGAAIGNVHRNAPYIITQMLQTISVLSLFLVPAFISGAVIRDYELGTDSSFFSTPISKYDLLTGRFCGGLVAVFFAVSGAAIGIMIAGFMPWLDPERLGPFVMSAYTRSMVLIVLPNLFFVGVICFALAALTRSVLYTYVGIIAVLVIFMIVGIFTREPENQFLVSLLDPFGSGAFQYITRYWTPAERNTLILPYAAPIVLNRLIWASVSVALLLFSFVRFRLSTERSFWFRRRKKQFAVETLSKPTIQTVKIPTVVQNFSAALNAKQFLSKTLIEFWNMLKSVPFIVICLFGVINVLSSAFYGGAFYGTKTYPVTAQMFSLFDGSFQLFLMVVIIIYAGELVWKERRSKLSEICDALPSPNWVPLFSKLMALAMIVAVMIVACMLSTMLFQLIKGYHNPEILLYVEGLFLHRMPGLILLCVLAIFFHVIANNKYVGYMLMVLFMVVTIIMATALDMEHNLYRFGMAPAALYSDMNGYGHFLKARFWFHTYWGFFSVFLLVLSLLLWVRGTEDRFKIRLTIFARRFTKPVVLTTSLALAGFVLSGSYIYYNTNVLNEYQSREGGQRYQADYEKTYKHIQDVPQPRITGVTCEVDIYPYQRRVNIRGTYTIQNKTSHPIDTLNVWLRPELTINEITIPGGQLAEEDSKFGVSVYRLKAPMMPSDVLSMSFDISSLSAGFLNRGSDTRIAVDDGANTRVVYNGTFITNMTFFPHFGYAEFIELEDRNIRKKFDLPPKERMAPVDDMAARMKIPLGFDDADRVSFEATVSTSADQIAIAPGSLRREWEQEGRRYFHYAEDTPIWNFYSFLSADYMVKRDKWNDVDIEIYYHRKHPYNIERMIYGIKKSLDYFTANFSSYQHKQVRIVEFPRYASFAQSFPSTIPYSEAIGFIARVEKPEDIDTVFYVTAHEVAHQWWAHQVMGGAVQGSALMTETLAQYSALMVMEKEYGKDHMRKFLKYELDRYLRGRAGEILKEMPLTRMEDQGYIHYQKGSVVMYALKDYIGEENLNRVLSDYIDAVAYQAPPYTNSLELLDFIRKATPDSLQYILEDMFETITLFENRTTDAVYEKTDDGKYRILLTVEAKKFRADELGSETEIPVNDWIDVGVFGGRPESEIALGEKALYLKKHKITEHRTEIEVILDEEPYRAGIDPYNKLIDKVSDDNTEKVKEMKTGV